MKNYTLIAFAIIFLFISCKETSAPTNNLTEKVTCPNTTTVEADLYFNWLRIGNFYGMEDSAIQNLEAQFESISMEETGKDSTLLSLYRTLKSKKLLHTPYIQVSMNDSLKTLWYLNEFDYDTIKTYSLAELEATNKKVHLTAEVEHLYANAYLCCKITKFEKLDKLDYQNCNTKLSGSDYK